MPLTLQYKISCWNIRVEIVSLTSIDTVIHDMVKNDRMNNTESRLRWILKVCPLKAQVVQGTPLVSPFDVQGTPLLSVICLNLKG